MVVFNLYDAAKLFAIIGGLIVVLAIVTAPLQALLYVIASFGHLTDNGMGYLKYIAYASIAVALVLLVTRQWVFMSMAIAVLLALSGYVAFTSSAMRGDVVAYGSERNEQWAAALANEPRWVDVAWVEPEQIRQLRDEVAVSCCTSELVLREEGSYPRDTSIGMRVGKYRIAKRGELATTTFLTKYIEVATSGAGDWLAYYNSCLAPAQWDMEGFATRYGAGAAERVAHENTMKLANRPAACKTMEGVDEAYALNLADTIKAAITRDGGAPAALLESKGLDAACAAHQQCQAFEADFAIDVK
ncbi:hypothetical protein BN1012_Phect496 [Candidatus Phaeomarinobacter ectocarpi]|uniref:Uncharacterized protein n=1 Tax=Candidatus Phaeomarinibacter ectocarpi TaxID=1458461 RepID=X5MKM8_9HYPH|nr:hypothetical protein BN1012_Phect496 [Candidatus Phaeomarinobacter ectocarpi]